MSLLGVRSEGSVRLLTLDRPTAMNALSSALAQELLAAIQEARADTTIRTVIVTGAGDAAFSAGADLKERRTLSADGKWQQSRDLWNVNDACRRSPKAVIAAVNGHCLGGGLELALHCDLRVAADTARFGFPEMTLGAYPGSGGAVILPRIIGEAKARDFLFRARRVGAAEALAIGLVHRVVPAAALMETALAMASEIETTAPLGLAAVKRLLDEGSGLSFEAASALDRSLRAPLDDTSDYAEGIAAHFEKRKPRFRGQ